MHEPGAGGRAGSSGSLRGRDTYGVLLADPETIELQADALLRTALDIRAVGRLLRQVGVAGTWESPAGRAFAARVGRTPQTLDEVAGRFEAIAHLLLTHAGELDEYLDELARIERRHDETARTLDLVVARVEALDPGEDQTELQRRWGELDEEARGEELAYDAVLARAHDADVTLARRLDAEVPGALDDDWRYDVLTGVEATGQWLDGLPMGAAWIPPVKAAQAAGSTAGFVATVTKKLGYGQGPGWAAIGRTGGLKAAGLVATRGGALGRELADAPLSSVARTRARSLWSKPRNPAVRTGSTARSRSGVRGWLRDRPGVLDRKARAGAEKQSGAAMVREMRADWAAVAGTNRTAQGVVLMSGGAKVGTYAEKKRAQATAAHEGLEGLRAGREERQREEQAQDESGRDQLGAARREEAPTGR